MISSLGEDVTTTGEGRDNDQRDTNTWMAYEQISFIFNKITYQVQSTCIQARRKGPRTTHRRFPQGEAEGAQHHPSHQPLFRG